MTDGHAHKEGQALARHRTPSAPDHLQMAIKPLLGYLETILPVRGRMQPRGLMHMRRAGSSGSEPHNDQPPRVEEKFGDLWSIHNRWFAQALTECRRYFNGDLDEALITAIIGTRSVYRERVTGISHREFFNGRRNAVPARTINVQSIADCSGVPRESVRRKVASLIDRGWVERLDGGELYITNAAVSELSSITGMTLAYFEEMQKEFR